jgi:stage V sporulation protein D (sporulation-specific penicillin-binding protein)
VDAALGERIARANLPGIGVLPSTKRVATDGGLAPHVLGFTDVDGSGLDGLERGLDPLLAGTPGVLKAEFDPQRRPIPGTIRREDPARDGHDVVLTLDADIQHTSEVSLAKSVTAHQAEAGTVVVLDAKTGHILALANSPDYDVNRRGGVSAASRTNRAVSAPFEPGSTLKVMTVAAALEEGKIRPNSRFYCAGQRRIGRRTIRCAHGERHGNESVTDVIRNSCNMAAAECGFRLGKTKLWDYERRFGFGERTGAGVPGESRGLLSPPSTWSDIQLSNVAFGQGIAVTPLQLAAAYGAIANDGVWMRPRIVLGTRAPGAPEGAVDPLPLEPGQRVVSAGVAREMRRMLQAVVDNGTGKSAALDGYTAGGKTGTAQIAERGRYGGKYVASFVGMAPVNDPQFVILVAVTAPRTGGYFGGVVAGPVFREIAEKALLSRRTPRDRTPETTDDGAGTDGAGEGPRGRIGRRRGRLSVFPPRRLLG